MRSEPSQSKLLQLSLQLQGRACGAPRLGGPSQLVSRERGITVHRERGAAQDQLERSWFMAGTRSSLGGRLSPLPSPSVPPVAAACRTSAGPASGPASTRRHVARPVPRVQNLTGRPPRAQHPVAGEARSPGRLLRSRRYRDGASRHTGVRPSPARSSAPIRRMGRVSGDI